jgi:hypothetical protein
VTPRRSGRQQLASAPTAVRDASHTLHPWRVLGVWLVMIAAETVHGVLRQMLLVPLVGDLRARQIGVALGSAIILAIAWWLAGSVGARTVRAQLAVGVAWVVLTVAFELGLGMLLGLSRERLLADYDPRAGGLMPLGLLVLALAPVFAARLRGRPTARS